jgi:3-oxoacyl-[acyl-carrier-protein] synthase II
VSQTARHRVAITGMGVVTPIGSTVDSLWASLVAGRSGVDHIQRFDASAFPTTFGAEVRDLTDDRLPLEGTAQALLERKDRYGWVAAMDALRDAAWTADTRPAHVGISIGTEARRPDLLARLAAGRLYRRADDHLRYSPFVLAGLLAREHGFCGPMFTVSTACTSGTQAVGAAFEQVRSGDADAMLAGGCDSLIDPMMLSGFSLLGALSRRNDDPPRASRPFDAGRDGFVLGEGAGMLVLENLAVARARGAYIHAEIMGYASTSNAYRLTDSPPDGEGAYLAMQRAISDAGLRPEQIGYINAHGTSTRQNDRSETNAIKRCFGRAVSAVPVSSTKSMTGHLVNAGGAVEAIICVLTLGRDVLPPTINLETPDDECDLDYVPNRARPAHVDYVLSNSFGFGGINASVVLSRGVAA